MDTAKLGENKNLLKHSQWICDLLNCSSAFKRKDPIVKHYTHTHARTCTHTLTQLNLCSFNFILSQQTIGALYFFVLGKMGQGKFYRSLHHTLPT